MQIHGNKMKDIIIIEKIIWSLKLKLNFIMCSIKEDFFSHAKRILGFFLLHPFFINFFFKIYLTDNIFFETYVQSDDY
jgi:hypothetical protein